MARHLPPEALEEWLSAACETVGVDAGSVDIALVLDLARDVAHGVARPAAPLTAFVAGLAAAGDPAAAKRAIAALSEKAIDWDAS